MENTQITHENGNNVNHVLATVFIPWIETKGAELPINKSCLCLRNGKRVCNLYFDGLNWKDDGFDSKDSRVFTDVTHYSLLECIALP